MRSTKRPHERFLLIFTIFFVIMQAPKSISIRGLCAGASGDETSGISHLPTSRVGKDAEQYT